MEIVHSKLMKQQGEGGDNMTNDAVRSKMASMCQGILDVNFKDGGQKNKDAGQKNQVRKQAGCSTCHFFKFAIWQQYHNKQKHIL